MSIFSKLATMVKVKDFAEQDLNDGSGSFPVVIVEGPVVARANDGSVRITKRDNVRVPMFGYDLEEVKEVFPSPGERIPGVKIEQYLLDTPREWENPETGEIITVQYGYTIIPTDGSLPQAPARGNRYSEPVSQRSKEHPPMEAQVFAGSSPGQNDLLPQI